MALSIEIDQKAIDFFLKLVFDIFRLFHGTQPIPIWARMWDMSSCYC